MVAAFENVEALQENAGVTIYAVSLTFKIVVLTNLTIVQLQEGHL